MKKVMVVAAVLMLIVSPVFAGKAVLVDRIVAVVNNEPITTYEIENLAPFFGISNEKELVNRVVDDYILEDYAKNVLGITVSESDINAYIDKIAEENGITPERLKKEVTSRGFDWSYYKKGVELTLYSRRAIRRLFAGEVFVTEKEVEEYYKKHAQEFKENPIVEVEMMFTQSKVAADRAEKALKSGKSFSSVASTYSEIGLRRQEMPLDGFSPSVRGIISSMNPGDVSPIIETKSGYFIIKLIKKEDSLSSEAVRNSIKNILVSEKLEQRVKEWLRSMRNSSNVVIIK